MSLTWVVFRSALGGGRWPEAVCPYEAALRLNPGYAEAHPNMATALQRLGSYAETQRHMEEASSTALLPGR